MRSRFLRAIRVVGGPALSERSLAQLMGDLAAVGVAVALVFAVTGSPRVQALVPLVHTLLALALATSAFAAMGAILAALVGRLTEDLRLTCISRALAVYGMVGVPASAISWLLVPGDPIASVARLTAHVVVVGLLVMAVRPPHKHPCWSRWSFVVVGLLVILVAALVAGFDPDLSRAVTSSQPLRFLLVSGAVVVGASLTVVGWRHSVPLGRVGLGFTVIALAHLNRMGVVSGWFDEPGLTFSVLRQLGVAVVLLGLTQLAYQSLRAVDETQSEYEERLRRAKIDLDRAAERDHELRNGLAGLAGATGVLAGPPSGEKIALCSAVAAELARLDTLLRGSDGEPKAGSYLLVRVLRDVVVLWRSTGMDIRLDAQPGLMVRGSSEAVAQVMTNLVANCARHAPGSPVNVRASRWGDRIRVLVSDLGPSSQTSSERAVYDQRVSGDGSGGQGLGLFISRKLLEANGATIRVLPTRADRPGFTVIVELPSAGAVESSVGAPWSPVGAYER